MRNRLLLLVIVLSALVSISGCGAVHSPKVVVLGFDGADPALVKQYMAEGALPNLQKLAKEGTFQDLAVTNPPQTPVSWGTFLTGWNPGRDEVFDFLRREPNTYKPRFALMEEGSRPFLLGAWTRWLFPVILLAVTLGALVVLRGAGGRRSPILTWFIAGGGSAAAVLLFLFLSTQLPTRRPFPVNHLQGKPFWKTAAETGRKCLVFRVPDTFPARAFPAGRLLSGLGVPDMRGRVGTPYLFTSDASLTAGSNEFSVEVVPVPPSASQPVTVSIRGPFNKPFFDYVIEDAGEGSTDPAVREELRKRAEEKLRKEGVKATIDVPITLSWDAGRGSCTLRVQGQTATIEKGMWSDWIVLDFAFNRVLHLEGMVRFYLLGASPSLKLYMSPIHFHPRDRSIPLSFPRDYARKLLDRFGYFKTMGWAIDTWTISSGLCGEDQFLSDVDQTVDAYERMMKGLLRDGDWDLYVQVYTFTDRVAHILWRYRDERSPMSRSPEALRYREALKQAYVRMDRIVGEARALLPKDATLIVLSDHGFTSFHKGVNTNRWLIDHGYMALKRETGVLTLRDLFDDDALLFKNVDWKRTRAYALGLGSLYVNLKGREPHGIVSPGKEYEDLCRKLQEELPRMVDPETGEHPVFAVYTRDQLYTGYDPDITPDLRVANSPGYRVSWQTSLGGAPEELIQVNLKPWSGDHCSMDPSFVPGSFFSNRRLSRTPRMVDMAPTILKCLGVSVPGDLEGTPLIEGPGP